MAMLSNMIKFAACFPVRTSWLIHSIASLCMQLEIKEGNKIITLKIYNLVKGHAFHVLKTFKY